MSSNNNIENNVCISHNTCTMHALWSGSVSFGLITIPVTLYSASKARALDFHLLRKKDLAPISFKRVASTTGEEVPFDEIVKGFEFAENKFVILEPEDFKRASPEVSERIDIDSFVDADSVDAKYFEKPYFLEPDKGADKAYVLLREALAQEKKIAVARMVFREREDLVVVKPDGDLLMLIQLRYDDEIRNADELKIPKGAAVSKKEVEMAIDLIDKMKGKFTPHSLHDSYAEKLMKIIKAKAKGEKLQALPEQPKATEPQDLVAQLKASLEKHN
jgi:DNA end-binding protein Ku